MDFVGIVLMYIEQIVMHVRHVQMDLPVHGSQMCQATNCHLLHVNDRVGRAGNMIT